jgi:hypothetical protein
MKQKIALKAKKQKNLRKQINGKFNNIGSANEKKKRITAANFFLCQKLKSSSSQSWIFSCVVSVYPAALNTV